MKGNGRLYDTFTQSRLAQYAAFVAFIVFGALLLQGQGAASGLAHDPGPRGGAPGAGGAYPSLNASEMAFFDAAKTRFQEIDSVSGTIPGEEGSGLGPTFNANSCAMCHAEPAVGGSSPGLASPQNSIPNPQIGLATLDRAPHGNQPVPPFITANGPVREARFILNPDGTTDGGVHGLYTIAGRTDAHGCTLQPPNFAQQIQNANVIFRIPTPIFGLGLVENTPDSTLQANLAVNAAQKQQLGIAGKLNTSGNDGTVTRFGWKAQNKSLLIFAGEAYNVEQGVSNEVFPNERSAVAGCVFNGTPEDSTPGVSTPVAAVNNNEASDAASDTVNFAGFMRLSAPPAPAMATTSDISAGAQLFNSIGCALCHSPSLVTAASPFTGMSNATYHPYSDFAVHHMGSTLADGITQGGAGPDEFRTAPLWGLGQRLFFLHDGRTSDLLQAIEQHSSSSRDCVDSVTTEQFEVVFGVQGSEFRYTPKPAVDSFCGSEANRVISAFNQLSNTQKQDILNFLRSL
ncbi:MAG TPA: di-heme oxidoredictase family protein [Blastocatellia bacterium]|nr:di-heme oxidoredictase family protein [Blastocatellia bacterium]